LTHFGVCWWGFFDTFDLPQNHQLLLHCFVHKQFGKVPYLFVKQLLESLCQQTSTLHILRSAYLREVQWHLPTVMSLPFKWKAFKDRPWKISHEILGMSGEMDPPDLSLHVELKVLRTLTVNAIENEDLVNFLLQNWSH